MEREIKEALTFNELVGESLGRASMAWSETPKGIFDSDACCVLHIDIMNAHNSELARLKEENNQMRECVHNIRDRLYAEIVSHRAFKIMDEEISKTSLAKINKVGI